MKGIPMAARPNILFILSDDQGPWALGHAGNAEILTPNLDILADTGARLENFFCASPVCSPARATLLTGMVPSRHGVHDFLAGHEAGSEGVDFLAGQPVFTDVLAENGYTLGHIGKWHLGASDKPRSCFDHWFALEGGSSDYHNATVYRGTGAGMSGGGVAARVTVTRYLTDAFAEEAMQFLEKRPRSADPFFLALNFTAPHKPWTGQHPERFVRLYEDCAFLSCPQEDQHPWQAMKNGRAIAGEPETRSALIGYFAAVSAMDEAIGRVLGRLQDLGLTEDTLVLFSSDNGFNCGHHGFWGKGNGTLPLNLYDTSVKVPAIFSQPGRIPSGRILQDLLSAYDIAATLLDLAGLDPAGFEQGPGRSFADLLLGREVRDEQHPVVVFDEYGPARMIRTRDWKYVHRYPLGPHELYDLRNDPGERNNEVGNPTHTERIADLRRTMHSWFSRHAAAQLDGSFLPVSGGGQSGLVGEDPLGAFIPRWES